MAERWAQQCAKLEKGAAGFLLEATQKYAEKVAEGWSQEAVAAEVTAAGFPISRPTVGRRLKALAQIEGSTGTNAEEAFTRAYAKINTDAFSGRLPQNEQGLMDHIQGASQKLYDQYDRSPDEIAGIVHYTFQDERAAKRIAARAEEIQETGAERNYRLASEALDLVKLITEPAGKRAETKLEVLRLEIDIRLGAEVR